MQQVLNRIREAVQKEKKLGCNDSAVFGGFAAFLLAQATLLGNRTGGSLGQEFIRLASLAGQYREESPLRRQEILLQIQAQLEKVAAYPLETLPAVETAAKGLARLDTGLHFLPNIGPKRADLFRRLGLRTIGDLLYYLPFRYEDWGNLTPISQLAAGEAQVIRGRLSAWEERPVRAGLSIQKAQLQDGSGSITAVWFNQPYIRRQLPAGKEIVIRGKVEEKYRQRQLLVQDQEIIEGEIPARIVPVYRGTDGLSQKVIRKATAAAWEGYGGQIGDSLPETIRSRYDLLPAPAALRAIHFPANMAEQAAAHRRLAFEECLLLQLRLLGNRRDRSVGLAHPPDQGCLAELERVLPFSLTDAQKRVIGEISGDMESPSQMARLVQGDVGSGKTAVAAAALLKTVRAGFQGAMMAPTEILAAQHRDSLEQMLAGLGVRVALLTGRTAAATRADLEEQLQQGQVDVVVGTHALIQSQVKFRNLGLAITDEQHRFGVSQRAALAEKGRQPDLLVMTATPIPRTLAMTIFGDLDVSQIDQMPPGRQAVRTYAVGFEMEDRVLTFIGKELSAGHQVYVVCPLVEESENLDLQAATELAAELGRKFSAFQVGLLHGRMKAAEKEAVMEGFRGGGVGLLVATTVIEVGINVPNATVMLVRDAQRFGLAQLHQLRGRIGRGSCQSTCILMHRASSDTARERMKVMTQTADGFQIAEADLKLRGPGEFLGLRQHGLPELRAADIFRDAPLLAEARLAAQAILADDPGLNRQENGGIARLLRQEPAYSS